jgi:small GTP-binding protein
MTKDHVRPHSSVIKRVAVMGAARTGKTNLISRFLGQPFEEGHTPTVEDYYIGKFYVGETLCHMEITDTSGSFEFPAMERLTMEKVDAFIFVYSLEDEQSFERVKACLKRLCEVRDISEVPIIVVCNKADLANIVSLRNMQMRLDNGDWPLQCMLYRESSQRQTDTCRVSSKEEILCTHLEQIREIGCEFLLTSAKFRWNVNRIFQKLFTERKLETEKKPGSVKTTFKFKIKRKKAVRTVKSV